MPRIPALPVAALVVVLGAISVPLPAQSPPPGSPPADSAPAKKLGRFGRLRAKVLPNTTYAGRLIAPILTEATEKGVPGLHVQNTIHEFTGPSGDYPALANGPADQLAERLRKLIREEFGQQSKVQDSIGTSANAMLATVTGSAASTSVASGLQLPADVPAALRAGRLSLTGINWSAGDMSLRSALASELKPVAAAMNQLGGQWRIEVAVTAAEGGEETARLRSLLLQNALVSAGVMTVNGGRAVWRPSKYAEAAALRVEVVRP